MDTYPLWLQDDSKLIGGAIDAYRDKCEAEGWTFDQPSHSGSGVVRASVAGELVSVLVVLRNVNGTLAVFRADQSEMVWRKRRG